MLKRNQFEFKYELIIRLNQKFDHLPVSLYVYYIMYSYCRNRVYIDKFPSS